MAKYILGIDIGTTCAKAVVIDELGNIVSEGNKGYRLISQGSQVEQNATDWITGTITAISQALENIDKDEVVAISTSTQGGSTVAVDKDGNFIGNAWTWMDKRSIKEREKLVEEIGEEYVYKTCGWRLSAALDLCKIREMKKTPEFSGASKFYTTLEVVNEFLTGNAVIDPTNSSIRELYSVNNGDWDEKLLNAAGVTREELPKILPTGAKVGAITAQAAKLTGLKEGTPVYNGAHDQYAGSIGAGIVNEGDLLLSAGTTWAIMCISPKPMFTDTYIAPGKHPNGLYGNICSLVYSGASLQWFNNNFVNRDFKQIDSIVAQRKEKTKDLFFYNYFAGANFPIQQPNARGSFIGITLEHDRYDFARAIMEGVAFGVRRALDEFARHGVEIKSITMMGGGSKSRVWVEILSSIVNIPITLLTQAEVGCIGAGIIAGCGAGIFKDYKDATDKIVKVKEIVQPNPEDVPYYAEKFEKFKDLWSYVSQYYK